MPVSARLSPLEQSLLDALALGATQTDVIREGLRLVWEQRGNAALAALGVLKPDKAAELVELARNYDQSSLSWSRALYAVAEGGVPKMPMGRPHAAHEGNAAESGEE